MFFVGNLAVETTEAELRAAFGEAGHSASRVTVARLPDDQRSRGYGFVYLQCLDPDAVISEMYGRELNGRGMRVQRSHSGRTHALERSTRIVVECPTDARRETLERLTALGFNCKVEHGSGKAPQG